MGRHKKIKEQETIKEESIPQIVEVDTEKQKKLKQILRDLNKKEGVEISFGNDILERGRISSGYKVVDKLLGGGYPEGQVITIWGGKSCGKTTLAYKGIASAQKMGKTAVYIDMERSYDPVWAAKYGVDINSLVYIKCSIAEEAFDAILKLCREKVADFIVLDSIQALSPKGEQYKGKAEEEKSVEDDSMALLARKLSQFFRMAIPYIADAKTTLFLIGQARMDLGSFVKLETLSGGHALMHNSRLIMKLRRGQGVDAPTEKRETGEVDKKGNPIKEDVKIGFDLVMHIDKAQLKGCIEGSEIHAPFVFTEGIQDD